jgi:hypothetical protein
MDDKEVQGKLEEMMLRLVEYEVRLKEDEHKNKASQDMMDKALQIAMLRMVQGKMDEPHTDILERIELQLEHIIVLLTGVQE